MKLMKSERNRYKKAAKELLYPDWVQKALDKAETEEAEHKAEAEEAKRKAQEMKYMGN